MKSIIIVGASSGIGRSSAKIFAQKGWKVIATARRTDKLEELRNEAPDRITTASIDVTQNDADTRLLDLIKENGGVDVVMFEGLNAGDKDFSAMVTKLKRAGVEFVYFGGYHPEMGLLLRQSRQAGLDVQFMGPEGVGNSDVTAIAGDAVEGMLVTLPRAFEADPRNKELVERITAAGKNPSGTFVMPGYAALQVIADGIKE